MGLHKLSGGNKVEQALLDQIVAQNNMMGYRTSTVFSNILL